jgi:protein TonB
MSGRNLLISVTIHVAIAAAALFFTARAKERARRPTSVTVVSEKKKEEAKKEEPKKPAPPPPKAAPRPAVAKAAPAAPVAAAAAPAPVDTGLTFGNDTGPGIAVGPARPTETQEKQAQPAPVKRAAPPPREHAECNEPPSKPEPLVRTHDIEYTDRARADGVEGRLVLRVTVAADGSVVKVEVLSPVEPALDAAAVATVQSWRFTPALACGKPVGGQTFTIARRFELGD